MKIWTEAYRPFMMGGDVNAPISTEVEVGEPVDLDHGIQVYIVAAPNGRTYVAESITGAFVGMSIDEVKQHIAEGDPEVIWKQIEDAKERVKKARPLDPEQFWSLLQ